MRIAFPLAAALVSAAALAAPATAQTETDERIRRVIVYGDDPCPRGSDDEIIVCARRPDNERFRIPEELRGQDQPDAESWASRAESIEYMGDTGIMSCSPVGPGGSTGCFEEAVRAWREERRRNSRPR